MIAIASLVVLSVPLMRNYPFLNSNCRRSLVLIGAVICSSTREDDLVPAPVVRVLCESTLLVQGPQFANHFVWHSHRLVLLLLTLLLRVVLMLLVQMI